MFMFSHCLFFFIYFLLFQRTKTTMLICLTPKWTLINGVRRPERRSVSPWRYFLTCWKNITVTNFSFQIETSYQQEVSTTSLCVCVRESHKYFNSKKNQTVFVFALNIMLLQYLGHCFTLCCSFDCCFCVRPQCLLSLLLSCAFFLFVFLFVCCKNRFELRLTQVHHSSITL